MRLKAQRGNQNLNLKPCQGVHDMTEIRWLNDLDEACRAAERQSKLVLLDFFSPT